MKCPPFPFIILFLFFGIQFGRDASAQSKNGFLVTLKGKSVSSIVLAKDATGADQQAATELQKYIRRISGATLQIAASARARGARAIRIGSAGHADGFPATVDWENLDDDGFSITTSGHSLFIAGGRRRGTLYAVYTLLESYLGCRKYSPTVEVIPRRPTIDLPTINTTQVPRLKFRDAFSYDPGYMAWHKLDNHDSLFGLYVHTFDRLVPPEKYFSDHPEYFSILNRKRRDDAQLCLKNADLGPIVINKLREYMAGDSAKQYWSVSQNDTFGPCECDSCRLVDSIEGSHAGSLLRFINRIAAEFPNKTISTLAYQYSRSAPKLVRPAPNVNIM
ncbi:MAG TPA: DUF4838 domain-containing protein, partial [Bacteroidota bacterium]|nr:DUF4838 domain-containing protein [Bacteroidota bacterium]